MAYSASVRAGQGAARSNHYRRRRPGSWVKKTFFALFRMVSISVLLVISLGFIVMVSIALLWGYNKAVNSDFLGLKEIEITGNKQLTYANLTQLMEVNPGDNLLQMNMSDIQARLKSNPWIDYVSVKRVFPDRLVVNLREKHAYFWIQEDDRLSYADRHGQIITPLTPERYVSLPIVYIEDHQVQNLEGAVTLLENRHFPFSLQDVTWVRVKQSGMVEMHISSNGMIVSMDSSLSGPGPRMLGKVWADLGRRGETESVSRIIVAGRNAWVAYGAMD